MPIVTVQVWEEALDEPTAARLIASVTEAVARVFGEHVRAHTTVTVTGVPRSRWGSAGLPASEATAAGEA